MRKHRKNVARRRPAETSTFGAGLLIAVLDAVDLAHLQDEVTLLIVGLSALPGIVSAVVDRYRQG